MALKPCPRCGNHISDKATKCPKCGIYITKDYFAEKVVAKKGEENSIDLNEKYKRRNKWWILIFAFLIIGVIVASILYFNNEKKNNEALMIAEQMRQDSLIAVQKEIERLEQFRQDSIAWVNFTTSDLSFKELYGHVKECYIETGTVNTNWPDKETIRFSKEGVLNPKNGDYTYIFTRNDNGQIIKSKETDATFGYEWKDGRISKKQLLDLDGETAWGGGDERFFYDNNGLLSYILTDDGEGEDGMMRNMKTTYSDYEFDEIGNWIKRKATTTYQTSMRYYGDNGFENTEWENQKEELYEIRRIVYYPNDLGLDLDCEKNIPQVTRCYTNNSYQTSSNDDVRQWIQGNWRCNTPYGESRVGISGNTISIWFSGEHFFTGPFEIRDDELVYNQKNGSAFTLPFNRQRKCLMMDESHPMQKY